MVPRLTGGPCIRTFAPRTPWLPRSRWCRGSPAAPASELLLQERLGFRDLGGLPLCPARTTLRLVWMPPQAHLVESLLEPLALVVLLKLIDIFRKVEQLPHRPMFGEVP